MTVNDATGTGAVTGLAIQNAGTGYSGGATLTMAPPPSNAYQVFSSTNLFTGVNTFSSANNGFTGMFSGSFAGNGAGVTNVNAAMLAGLTTANFWQLGGNSGSDPRTDFLGTRDTQALEFKVNNTRALRLEPTADDANHAGLVNVVLGSSVNFVGPGVYGATIAGGGAANYFSTRSNSVFADLSTLGGGGANTIQASASDSTLGGGYNNTIQFGASSSTLGGGYGNTIQTNASASTLGGGEGNTIQANAYYSTLGGGDGNSATGSFAVVPGGDRNVAGPSSFAAGHRAKATHTGAFVWADATDADFATTANNQFLLRASGGVGIGTSAPGGALGIAVAPGQTLQFRLDGGVAPGINVATSGNAAGVMRLRNVRRSGPATMPRAPEKWMSVTRRARPPSRLTAQTALSRR